MVGAIAQCCARFLCTCSKHCYNFGSSRGRHSASNDTNTSSNIPSFFPADVGASICTVLFVIFGSQYCTRSCTNGRVRDGTISVGYKAASRKFMNNAITS